MEDSPERPEGIRSVKLPFAELQSATKRDKAR
jgi:hypothetical protein